MDFTNIALWIGALAVVLIPLALMLYADSRGMFDEIGGGPFSLDEFKSSAASASSDATSKTEREQEIRQLVEARNHRRLARGEPPIDTEAEIERLLALDSTADPTADRPAATDRALREEVRGLVLARNARRQAKGQPALDVEAEIDRQLRDAGA